MTAKVLVVNSPKYDLLTALIIEGLLKRENLTLGFTSLGNYAPADKVLRGQTLRRFRDDVDVIVLGSRPVSDDEIFWNYRGAATRVVLEGGDDSLLNISPLRLPTIDLLFKREFYQTSHSAINLYKCVFGGYFGLWSPARAHCLMPFPQIHSMKAIGNGKNLVKNLLALPFKSRVKPLPLGIEDRFVGQFNHNPQWKLSCMLRSHIKERVQLISLLEGMQRDDIFIGLMPAKASHRQFMIDKAACHPTWNNEDSIGFAQNTEYLAQLNDSQSVVSIPGGGFDTLRFWEILGQGSLLLSKRVALQVPEPLIEDKHYLAFDSFEEFQDRLSYLDSHPDLVDQIRYDGWSHALAHHTSQARATYLLNLILPREAED